MILKILVLCSFIHADLYFAFTYFLGKRVRQQKCSASVHRLMGWVTFFMTLIAVLLTEYTVSTLGRGRHDWFFYVHLFGFAIPYLISLPMLLLFNGKRSKKSHGTLACTALVLCIGMNITGFVLWCRF